MVDRGCLHEFPLHGWNLIDDLSQRVALREGRVPETGYVIRLWKTRGNSVVLVIVILGTRELNRHRDNPVLKLQSVSVLAADQHL